MTSLIASIGTGKGTWAHVDKLISDQEWDSVIIVTNEFGKEKFKPGKPVEFIVINENSFLEQLTENIKEQLQGRIADTEVAVNLVSGTGKEHMALMSALLKLGLGVRLTAITPDGVKET